MVHKGKSRKILLHGGAEIANTDPYGNNMEPQNGEETAEQVCHKEQIPASQEFTALDTDKDTSADAFAASGRQPISHGIIKNLKVDYKWRSFQEKWFLALFSGIPFLLDDEVTRFQVFPDRGENALNTIGNAYDQVIVYGKLNAGAVSADDAVEIYGRRDTDNNIVVKKIKNKTSGTTIEPGGVISVGVVWTITVAVFLIIAGAAAVLGTEWMI